MFGLAPFVVQTSLFLLAGANYAQAGGKDYAQPPQQADGSYVQQECEISIQQLPQDDFQARNLRTIQSIYNLTIYPNNVPIIAMGGSAVPPGLFDQQARGRISPLGNFTDFETSIEYFWGLAPTPQSNNAGLGVYEAEIVSFTSGCPEIAASVVYLKTGAVNNVTGGLLPGSPTTILRQVAFWKFDAQGLVAQYDAWLPNLQLWTKVANGIDYDNKLIQQGTVSQAICPTVQQRCTGQYQQYQSVEDCTSQLLAKEFGDFDEVWGDNIVCRLIHLILTVIRPDIHCSHVGPTGGGKCVNIDFRVDYFDDINLYGSAEPFKCPQLLDQTQGSLGNAI